MHDALGDAGAANALIELDELARAYPEPSWEQVMARLAWLAGSYRDYPLLFVTATLEDDEDREDVLAAVAADEHVIVRLEAHPDTLRARIVARDPPGWSGLPDQLRASRELAASMPSLAGVDVVLSTEGREAEDVAGELRSLIA